MEHGRERELESLRREVAALRGRVAELARGAARFDELQDSTTISGLEVSISEREELLLEAERIGHVGSWFWNIETDQVVWSDELFRIFGYDIEQDRASSDLFFAAVHPDDRPTMQATIEHALKSGQSPQIDYRVLRRDGTLRYVTMAGSMLFDDSGRLRRIVGAVSDLTEEHQARERLREMNARLEEAQSIASLGSWTLDTKNGSLSWSNEFYRIIGLPLATQPSNELFLSRVVEEDRERFANLHRQILEGAPSGECEGRIVRSRGEIGHVRVRGVAHRDAQGQVESIHGTMLDVTEHVRMQQKLLNVRKMEAVGRLAGGIAHDFNNLLTVISINLELLRNDVPQHQVSFEDTFRALDSAKSLVQRLLAFGQRVALVRKSVEPNALVHSTLRLLSRLVGDQIVLRASLAEPLPMIDVDPLQIEQALINLVVNARDALGAGGMVVISTELVALDGASWVEISVADNGPGINEETRAQIFEPFFTTKGERGGTGLGLSTVLGTAEQHGGTISVESNQPTGTVFHLRLPTPTLSGHAGTRTIMSTPSEHPDQQRTILLIEDEPMIASVLKRGLERRGHTVFVAHGAKEARSVWSTHRLKFDIIVCDMVMPVIRGPELVAEFGIDHNGPKIVFITGYSKEMAEQVLDYPILTKPFSIDDLHKVIEQQCGGTNATAPNRTAANQ